MGPKNVNLYLFHKNKWYVRPHCKDFILKIGQSIRVLDKEYDVEGKLVDISFFFMYIRNAEGYLITIPTSVALQKTMVTKEEVKKK